MFEVTAGLYYWTFVGLVFLAMRLDQEAMRAAAARAAVVTAKPMPQPAPAWHLRTE